MKRLFEITVSPCHYPKQTYSFNVIATAAEDAIRKAKAAGRREFSWRGGWLVHSLAHKGPVV